MNSFILLFCIFVCGVFAVQHDASLDASEFEQVVRFPLSALQSLNADQTRLLAALSLDMHHRTVNSTTFVETTVDQLALKTLRSLNVKFAVVPNIDYEYAMKYKKQVHFIIIGLFLLCLFV